MNATETTNWRLSCTGVDRDDEGCARFMVNSDIPERDRVQTEAAAKAMEAAPDLLAACSLSLKYITDYYGENHYVAAAARAAIAKATA